MSDHVEHADGQQRPVGFGLMLNSRPTGRDPGSLQPIAGGMT